MSGSCAVRSSLATGSLQPPMPRVMLGAALLACCILCCVCASANAGIGQEASGRGLLLGSIKGEPPPAASQAKQCMSPCPRVLLRRVLVAAAVERLQDSKAVVRGLTLKMLRRLMAAVRPQPVLDLLAARGGCHSSWRVREEVINAHIMVGS